MDDSVNKLTNSINNLCIDIKKNNNGIDESILRSFSSVTLKESLVINDLDDTNVKDEILFVRHTLKYADHYLLMNVSNKHIREYLHKTLNKLNHYKNTICLEIDNPMYSDMSTRKKKQFTVIIRKLHNLIIYIKKYESFHTNEILRKIRSFNQLIIKFINK
jgi:hypothetical protein